MARAAMPQADELMLRCGDKIPKRKHALLQSMVMFVALTIAAFSEP